MSAVELRTEWAEEGVTDPVRHGLTTEARMAHARAQRHAATRLCGWCDRRARYLLIDTGEDPHWPAAQVGACAKHERTYGDTFDRVEVRR